MPPSAREMAEDERATEAVLTFLRDTRVECAVSLAPLEEKEGRTKVARRRGQACPGRRGEGRPGRAR